MRESKIIRDAASVGARKRHHDGCEIAADVCGRLCGSGRFRRLGLSEPVSDAVAEAVTAVNKLVGATSVGKASH